MNDARRWCTWGGGWRVEGGGSFRDEFKDMDKVPPPAPPLPPTPPPPTHPPVNAHDTAVPLLWHAPTHLESAHGRSLLSFGCGAVRRTNTRPKAPIDSQWDGGRGGPVAAFSHLVSLCARKNGSVYYERGGAGALSVRERMRMEARGREGMKGDDTRRETRI